MATEPTPTVKLRCQFQGGIGLEAKYRSTSPCLGEFEARPQNAHRSKYCKVCAPLAKKWLSAQNANARYKAQPNKYAKTTRENRWKRRKAAGRPCPRLGVMVPCKYRDERGRRGKGCLGEFERKSSFQKYCAVCQKHADADRAQKYRDTHHAELLPMYRAKGKRLRDLAALGKQVAAGRLMAATRPEPTKPRGRPIAKATWDRIQLAARLRIEGLSPYEMTDELCPAKPGLSEREKTATRHKRFHDQVDPFLRRNRGQIELEVQRLAAPPASGPASLA